MMETNFQEDIFGEKVKKNDSVIAYFYTDDCPASKLMTNELRSFTNIIYIDAKENRELCKKLNIISVPCIIIFNNSKIINRINGYKHKEILLNQYNAYFHNHKAEE